MFWKRYAGMIALNGVVFGIFLATVFFLIVFWIIDISDGEAFRDYFVAILVIASTVGTAFLALLGITRQIQDNRDLDQRNRDASLGAAKALLPIALSNLVKICRHNLSRNFHHNDLLFVKNQANGLKECDQETFSVLKESIQFADHPSREALTKIIRTYQIVLARTDRVNGRPLVHANSSVQWQDYERNEDAIEWAALHALVSASFEYARGRSNSIPECVHADEVKNALQTAGVDFDVFPNLALVYEVRRAANRLFILPR